MPYWAPGPASLVGWSNFVTSDLLLRVLQVTVGNDTLTQVVQVANSKASDKPLKFTTALHTYFRVLDISQVHIEGLSGLKYLDNMQNRLEGTDEQDVIAVAGEIDRIYVKAPDQLKVSCAQHASILPFIRILPRGYMVMFHSCGRINVLSVV